MGFEALSITDHGNVSGTYEFYKECKKAGLKPILGMEAYYTVFDRSVKEQDDLGNSRPNYHMILLAQNIKGYKNLIKLSSKAYLEGFYYSPRIDDALIAEYNEGIIATSACLGSRISQLILHDRKEDAKKLLQHHAAIFKDRYFLELQCHYDPEQVLVNKILLEFAKELNLPLVLTADAHYLAYGDKQLHDKFLCISTNSKVSDKKRFNFGDLDCHLATPDEMEEKRKQFNLPEEAISNTWHIANMCTPDYFSDVHTRYPTFKDKPENVTSDEYLEMIVKMKWLEKNENKRPPEDIANRIIYELKTIKQMGYSDYFLILADLVENGAEKRGIMAGPGRGSSSGSMVSYLLGITKVDPLKYNIPFERMINRGRGSIPRIF